jgi:cell division septation protein DedD
VVRFQDSASLPPARSTNNDYTWSAPVWYDPTHADVPLTIIDDVPPTSSPTPTATSTATATPTSTPTATPTSTATATPQPDQFFVDLPLIVSGN